MRPPFDVLRDRLAIYLGPHTARSALRTFADKSLAVPLEEISTEQARRLLEKLRPVLKTLVGAAQSDRIVSQLTLELELHA